MHIEKLTLKHQRKKTGYLVHTYKNHRTDPTRFLKLKLLPTLTDVWQDLCATTKHSPDNRKYGRQIQSCKFKSLKYANSTQSTEH